MQKSTENDDTLGHGPRRSEPMVPLRAESSLGRRDRNGSRLKLFLEKPAEAGSAPHVARRPVPEEGVAKVHIRIRDAKGLAATSVIGPSKEVAKGSLRVRLSP